MESRRFPAAALPVLPLPLPLQYPLHTNARIQSSRSNRHNGTAKKSNPSLCSRSGNSQVPQYHDAEMCGAGSRVLHPPVGSVTPHGGHISIIKDSLACISGHGRLPGKSSRRQRRHSVKQVACGGQTGLGVVERRRSSKGIWPLEVWGRQTSPGTLYSTS